MPRGASRPRPSGSGAAGSAAPDTATALVAVRPPETPSLGRDVELRLGGGIVLRLRRDPASGAWHVFVNRCRTMLKVLAFDRGGYWIWSKHLERAA